MKVKKRIIIMAILFGILTAFLVISYLNSSTNNIPTGLQSVNVVVAVKDIPENVKITSDMIEVQTLPSNSIHVNAIRKLDDALGQITSDSIIAGEQILNNRLAVGQSDTSVSYTIPENMRAIAIPINETSGVAGFVSVGDKIDLLINDDSSGKNVTSTQMQNITVLKKGVNPGNNAELASASQGITDSLTILVTPAQAEVLAYAMNNKKAIVVTLRNPADTKNVTLAK